MRHPIGRRKILTVGSIAVTALAAAVTATLLATSAEAATTLGAQAATRAGTSVRRSPRAGSATRRTPTIAGPRVQHGHGRERDEAGRHRAARASSTSAAGDQIVQLGQRARQRVRGHTLAWHGQQPGWVQSHERQRRCAGDDQPHQRRDGPLQGQDLRLGRGERGVRRGGTAAGALEPAGHRQRLDRGGVPHRAGRRPGRKLCYNDYNIENWTTPRRRACTTWSRTSSPAACRSTASACRPTSTAAARASNFQTTLSELRRPRRGRGS